MSVSENQKTASGREPMIVREQRAWRMYVDSLLFAPYHLSKEHVAAVLKHWEFLKARLYMQVLHTPVTMVNGDGYVALIWNTETRTFDIEVTPEGKIHWFYRDRTSRETDGTEDDPEREISEEAVTRLRSVLQVYKRSKM